MATTIYSSTNDGFIYKASSPGVTSWADARDATSGTATYNDTKDAAAVRALIVGAGRGTSYSVSRAFFEFDVSGITHLPQSGSLEIHGYSTSAADMRLVKSSQSATLANADFDEIEGWVAGAANHGAVTYYDNTEITSWDSGDYNSITLSQQALVDIAGFTLFKCCLIEFDQDLRNVAPTAPAGLTNKSGVTFADNSGTSSDPKIVIVEQDSSVFFGANF